MQVFLVLFCNHIPTQCECAYDRSIVTLAAIDKLRLCDVIRQL